MGTDKRERQKANRQLRLEQLAKEQQREQTKRRALQVGLAVAAAVVIALIFFLIGGGDDEDAPTDTTVATETTETTVGADTTSASIEPAAPTIPGGTLEGAAPCPGSGPEGDAQRIITFDQPPPDCLTDGSTYQAVIVTNRGDFTIELDAEQAPTTVNNFVFLARYHYFDGTECHRIVPDFVVQCGDPTATGQGGPGYEIADELPASVDEYVRGAVAMANSGPNTNGSQFFVVTSDNGPSSFQAPNYSLFGSVTDGLDNTIANLNSLGTPEQTPSALVQIESVTIVETPA